MDFEKQQQAYRNSRPSIIGRGFEIITNPVGGAVAGFVPSGLVRGVLQGIDQAIGAPQLVRFDHDLSDLAACQNAAERVAIATRAISGTTGAASGIGGILTMGLDIPATLALALRCIRDTGRAYGYDGKGARERLFRLQVLELAGLNDKTLRAERLAALEAGIGSDGNLTEMPADEIEPIIEQAVERVSRALAIALFRRRVGAVVPLVGSVIGGAVNVSFQGDVGEAARFAFQERRLKAGKA
ncbi:EcsC family protein [Alteriqipengyuania sp.]|uniref:EcsC family protein n=1 Tax=Alteriqipengyuania sp. TaxID=2800692 RepID=UPI0035164593